MKILGKSYTAVVRLSVCMNIVDEESIFTFKNYLYKIWFVLLNKKFCVMLLCPCKMQKYLHKLCLKNLWEVLWFIP